jgi:hypothetical protein
MADSAVQDLEVHVVRTDGTAFDRERLQVGCC